MENDRRRIDEIFVGRNAKRGISHHRSGTYRFGRIIITIERRANAVRYYYSTAKSENEMSRTDGRLREKMYVR